MVDELALLRSAFDYFARSGSVVYTSVEREQIIVDRRDDGGVPVMISGSELAAGYADYLPAHGGKSALADAFGSMLIEMLTTVDLAPNARVVRFDARDGFVAEPSRPSESPPRAYPPDAGEFVPLKHIARPGRRPPDLHQEREEMSERRIIRMFPDFGHPWPLWETNDKHAMEPSDYYLSQNLTAKLRDWYDVWERSIDLNHAGPARWRGNPSKWAWQKQGELIADQLRAEVVDFATVEYSGDIY